MAKATINPAVTEVVEISPKKIILELTENEARTIKLLTGRVIGSIHAGNIFTALDNIGIKINDKDKLTHINISLDMYNNDVIKK